MAQEHDELLDHEYDGIREFDNPLPRWWLWLFYGTVVFGVFYLPYYLLGFGPSSGEMYRQELASTQPAAPQGAAMAPMAGHTADATVHADEHKPAGIADPSVVGNAGAIAEGKGIYLANCLPCHGDQGQGLIGPNLTDRYWIHGNRFEDVVNTIYNGVPDKGMIPWKSTLNPQKINQVAAFVLALEGTNPPNPKPPQGVEVPK
jgi:cytochrome c oxidase cbb3-type subunit 3